PRCFGARWPTQADAPPTRCAPSGSPAHRPTSCTVRPATHACSCPRPPATGATGSSTAGLWSRSMTRRSSSSPASARPGDMSWEPLEGTGAALLRRLGPGALRAVTEHAMAGWPREAILRHTPDAEPLLDALADTDRSAALAYLTGLAAGYAQRAG